PLPRPRRPEHQQIGDRQSSRLAAEHRFDALRDPRDLRRTRASGDDVPERAESRASLTTSSQNGASRLAPGGPATGDPVRAVHALFYNLDSQGKSVVLPPEPLPVHPSPLGTAFTVL